MPILSPWFNILNKLLIMDSLIGIIKDFVSRFFTMFPFYTPLYHLLNLCSCDVFREYKTRTLGRHRSIFLINFSLVFLFHTACKIKKTLGLLLFPGGIKSAHWGEMGEAIGYLCWYLQNLRTAFFKKQLSLTSSGFLNGSQGNPF